MSSSDVMETAQPRDDEIKMEERFNAFIHLYHIFRRENQDQEIKGVYTDPITGELIEYQCEKPIEDWESWRQNNPDRYHMTNGDVTITISNADAIELGYRVKL